MRKATRTAAITFGLLAGVAGIEHGITEILQGNVHPASLMFPSMGAPCAPDVAWHACEPAMTLLSNLLIAGIVTVVLCLLTILWSVRFMQSRYGGVGLILLSLVTLLAGGGFFPPLIGIVGGIAGLKINKPLNGHPGKATRFFARLWPWPLVILVAWLLGQYPVGYFFNNFLKGIMPFGLLLIVVMLLLSVYTGYAHDVK